MQQTLLISNILSEIVSDIQHKCVNLAIKYEYKLTKSNAFLFINAIASDITSVISHLMENTVESMPQNGGKIELKLKANEKWVHVSILDNGCGIDNTILDKIKNEITATNSEEKNYHGINLTQIRDMLKNNDGKFSIMSSTRPYNNGTTINLSFPRIDAPEWIIDEINLYPDDTVIILGDDPSIYAIWENRFSYILEKIPTILIKYFSDCNKVLDYLADISIEEKQKIYLLCDYELNQQKFNGLDIIKKSNIKRSILLTNYFIMLIMSSF